MIPVEQLYFEEAVDILLSSSGIGPTVIAHSRRRDVSEYIKSVLMMRLVNNCFIVSSGSFPLLTYLPDSDLDIVVFCRHSTEQGRDIEHILPIFNALCQEIAAIEDDRSSFFKIRNVEFINARIKLSKCYVNNIGVDIIVNQLSGLATLVFLEEADRRIGRNNLVKRSILLVKNWCLHESANYCGQSLLGSRTGGLTSYAVSIMVLYLFNKFSSNLDHPFSVLRCFLFTYSNFNWDNFILSLDGPLPINSSSIGASPPNQFRAIQDKLHTLITSHNGKNERQQRFVVRLFNIQDPVNFTNNLGTSVTLECVHRIKQALVVGSKHLESVLHAFAASRQQRPIHPRARSSSDSTAPSLDSQLHSPPTLSYPAFNITFLREFFPNSSTLLLSDIEVRADMKDHPLQQFDDLEALSRRKANSSPLNLDGDLDRMWSNLNSALEICSMNEGSYDSFLRLTQKPTPPRCELPPLPEDKAVEEFPAEDTGSIRRSPDAVQNGCAEDNDSAVVKVNQIKKKKMKRRRKRSIDCSSGSGTSGETGDSTQTGVDDGHLLPSESTSRDEMDDEMESTSSSSIEREALEHLYRPRALSKGTDQSVTPEMHSPTISARTVEVDICTPLLSAYRRYPMKRETIEQQHSSASCKVVRTSKEVVPDSSVSIEVAEADDPDKIVDSGSRIANTVAGKSWIEEEEPVGKRRAYSLSLVESNNMIARRSIEKIKETVNCSQETAKENTTSSAIHTSSRGDFKLSVLELLKQSAGETSRCKDEQAPSPTSRRLFLARMCLTIIMISGGLVVLVVSIIFIGRNHSVLLPSTSNINMHHNSVTAPIINIDEKLNKFQSIMIEKVIEETQWARLGSSYSLHMARTPTELGILDFDKTVWRKDGKDIATTQSQPYSFGISRIAHEDAGLYECIVMMPNGDRRVVSRTILKVSVPPIIKSKPSYSELNVGDPFLIYLIAEATPPPSFQWYKNGVVIPGEKSNKLHIISVEHRHTGTYSCLVENVAGSVIWLEATISIRPLP